MKQAYEQLLIYHLDRHRGGDGDGLSWFFDQVPIMVLWAGWDQADRAHHPVAADYYVRDGDDPQFG